MSMIANTLPSVSWDGMPLGMSRNLANHSPVGVAEPLDVRPRVGSGGDGADGDCDDVDEAVSLGSLDSGVFDDREVVEKRRRLRVFHESHPSFLG